jgi:glycolate oxidase FAD binding subunit
LAQPQSSSQPATTAAEFAAALAHAASHHQTITLEGHATKQFAGGPIEPADITLTTRPLNRILQYEPTDLTISVEAGIGYRELSDALAKNRQMIPLDPPYADNATIGGILAVNHSGPRRRQFGTARDLVIGMQFATIEGKLVQSGGMVVKNVAGLDMSKLLIGSYGTLAAITSVNFKLTPMPEQEETVLLSFATAAEATTQRDLILQGQLHPVAIDLLNPAFAESFALSGFVLALQFAGNAASVTRSRKETGGDAAPADFWPRIRAFTATADDVVIRISCKLTQMAAIFNTLKCPSLGRAGNGVIYARFASAVDASAWISRHGSGVTYVVESAPEEFRRTQMLWPASGSDFAMMKKIKDMFDPRHLLNRGRLFRAL